ncbi:MAG: alpha/beta hydrolase [Clostridia bacterium]|nr:alpha/beta hydrolase [Clostridia bacterium]
MKVTHSNFKSKEGTKINYLCWEDDNFDKDVLVLVHGMAEHIGRYDEIGRYFASKGFKVYGNDHLGHGGSIDSSHPLGYFGQNNSNGEVFKEDLKTFIDMIRQGNPNKKIYLIGHSMGSFIVRIFMMNYPNSVDGVVLCSTTGPQPMLSMGMALTKFMIKLKGEKYHSDFINQIAFGAYNKKTEKRTPVDWLNRDEKAVDSYIEDALCGYLYSLRGYLDMFEMTKKCTSDEFFDTFPKNMPLMFISGNGDPIGNYLKGVSKTVEEIKKRGINPTVIFYKDGERHELLKELNKVQIYEDIIEFINKNK